MAGTTVSWSLLVVISAVLYVPTHCLSVPTVPPIDPIRIPTAFTELLDDDLDGGILSEFDFPEVEDGSFCDHRFPRKEENVLNSPFKLTKFKGEIRDATTKEVFDNLAEGNSFIDFSDLDTEEVREFLEVLVDEDGDLLKDILNEEDLTQGKEFVHLVEFVVHHPEAMGIFKKPAIEHVLKNLTLEGLEELCENLDDSELSEAGVSEILKDFPQCVGLAQKYAKESDGKGKQHFQHGRAILDRIRSSGTKLNVTDFAFDPSHVTVADIDGLKSSDVTDLASLQSMAELVHMLEDNVVERFGERIADDIDDPSSWSPEIVDAIVRLIAYMPDDFLQEHVDDELLETFLAGDFMLSKRVVAFMIETLYVKRNEPSFHKRFCLSIYYHPYITVSMLDDFTSQELWDALVKCPHIFYDMSYSNYDMLMMTHGDEYYDNMEDFDDDDDDDEKDGGGGGKFHMEWDDDYAEYAYKDMAMGLFLEDLEANIMQLRPLMRRIFSDKKIKLTKEQLIEFAVFLPAAPIYVFENLEPEVLHEVWPKIEKFGKYPVSTLEIVGEKLFETIEKFDISTLHLLGQALSVIPCKYIHLVEGDQFPLFVLSGYFKENKHFSCEGNTMVCRVIANLALEEAPKGLRKFVVDNLGPLSKFLDSEDFLDGEIFFNEYLPEHVEKDMFKKKDKEERENGDRDGNSRFNVTDGERVLESFNSQRKKKSNNGTKLGYKDALMVKLMEGLMEETAFEDLDFDDKYGGKPPKMFNVSYLETIDFSDDEHEFVLDLFGDIEEFLYTMFNVTFEDIVYKMVHDKDFDIGDLDVEDDHGFFFANEDFLEEMPENEESLEFLGGMKDGLKQKEGGIGDSFAKKELTSGFKVIKNMFELDGSKTDVCLDESVIESLDCYFTQARKYELDNLDNKTRKSILVAEGKSHDCVSSMSPNEIHEHLESLLEVDEELRDAEEWGEELLMRTGPALLCGMEEDQVSKLTPKAAVRFSDILCQCRQLSNGARKAVYEKIKAFYNNDIGNIFTPPYNTDVASCLMYAPSSELRSMTEKAKKIFVAMGSRVLDEIHHYLDSIDDMGFFGVDEIVEERLSAEELASSVWMIMDELEVPAMDRMSQVSQFKSVINVDFINELSEEDFEEAIDFLQDFDDWTDGQKKALSVKIDETFGDVANWSSADVLRLGGLLSARLETQEDFSDLKIDECSMDFILDRFSDHEDFFEGFCEEMTVENALKTMEQNPQALCCMDKEDASILNATFIMQGLYMMGSECPPCLKKHPGLMEELARIVAEDMSGAEATSKEFFENLKCLAGKMPVDYLKDLPTDRFERFDKDALETMDPEVFCKVASKDVLKGMTIAQSEAIDDAKMECMDIEQFEAFFQVVDGEREEEYHFDEDEIFPDLSKTEIGDLEEFQGYLDDFSSPMIQSGIDNQNVQCVSPKGANIQEITDSGKQKLRGKLTGDDLTTFNAMDDDDKVHFTDLSESDIISVVEKLHDTFDGLSVDFEEFLTELPTMVDDPSVSNYDETLDEVFEHLNPQIYLIIEPTFICDSVKKLKKKHLAKLCGRMLEDDVSTHTFLTINTNCPVCFTYWIKERKDESFYDILDENTAAAFYNMRLRQDKALDLEILALGPRGITPDVIKAVDPKSFASVSQLAVLSHPKVAKQIPKNSIKLILKKVIDSLGPVKEWNKMIKSRLQYFLFYLPKKDLLEQLTPSDVIEIVTSREGQTESLDDPEIRKILGQIVSRYVQKKSSNMDKDILERPEVFCLLLSSGMPRKLLDQSTSPYKTEFLLEMAAECSEFYDIPPSAARSFFRAILKDTTEDASSLGKIKDVLQLLPVNDISKFPKKDLKDLWGDIKDQEFDDFQLRIFWDAVKDDVTTIDCTKADELGQLLRVVPRSLIDGADLLDCLEDVIEAAEREEEEELPKSLSRGLWTMAKAGLKADNIKISDFMLGEDFPGRAAAIIPKSEFNSLEWDFTDKDVRNAAFKIAEALGDEKSDLVGNLFRGFDLDDPEIQEHLLENDDVAQVVFSFMDDDELDNLQSGDAEGSMLEELAKDVEDMSTRALEKNVALMKRRINLTDDCTKETVCLDEGQAWVLGPLFVGIRPNQIECFTQTTREIIVESLGQHKKLCKRMTKAVIQKLLSLVNPTQAIADGEDVDILYGCMICGFTKAQIEGMSDEQVVLLQDTLSGCHQFEKDIKDVIMNKMYNYYGGFDNYLEANPDVGAGTLVLSVSPSDLRGLDEDTLEYIVASLGDITSALSEEFVDLQERKDRGEVTAADYDDYYNGAMEVLATIYDLIAPGSPTRRRKRAADDADEECDILSQFNGNLCFMTETQINALSDQTVADCASEFQTCTYSDALSTTLATKAKTALGTTADWTANDYASLGKLLGYMGDTTIGEMELTDDIMDAIPDVDIENGGEIFNQYLTHNSKSLSDLTGENIADYALLLGDMGDTALNDLQPSAVADAVTSYNLGGKDLEALDDDVVELFTNKLIESDQFNFTSASSSDISNLGLMAGELPENILTDLSTDQKSGISADAIKLIEPDVLANSFTATDFASLTSEQANAMSEDQLSQLSDDQRNVVTAISTTVLDDEDEEGGAPTVCASFGLLTTLAIITSFLTVRMN